MNDTVSDTFRDDKGSTLISTLLLLLFLTFLMTASAAVIKYQVIQYKQTAHSYETKAMIEMTEVLISSEENGNYPSSVQFSKGQTAVEQLSDRRYKIKATLTNRYTSQKTIELPMREGETGEGEGDNEEDPLAGSEEDIPEEAYEEFISTD